MSLRCGSAYKTLARVPIPARRRRYRQNDHFLGGLTSDFDVLDIRPDLDDQLLCARLIDCKCGKAGRALCVVNGAELTATSRALSSHATNQRDESAECRTEFRGGMLILEGHPRPDALVKFSDEIPLCGLVNIRCSNM